MLFYFKQEELLRKKVNWTCSLQHWHWLSREHPGERCPLPHFQGPLGLSDHKTWARDQLTWQHKEAPFSSSLGSQGPALTHPLAQVWALPPSPQHTQKWHSCTNSTCNRLNIEQLSVKFYKDVLKYKSLYLFQNVLSHFKINSLALCFNLCFYFRTSCTCISWLLHSLRTISNLKKAFNESSTLLAPSIF